MTTIKDIFIVMFLAVAGVGVMFGFVSQVAVDNGAQIENSRINVTYERLVSYQNEFNKTLDSLQVLSNNASEASVGDFAYFGIRGMVAIMKAPFNLVTVIYSAIGDVTGLFSEFIPKEIITAALLIGLTIMIFSGIKFLTSRGQEP